MKIPITNVKIKVRGRPKSIQLNRSYTVIAELHKNIICKSDLLIKNILPARLAFVAVTFIFVI